LNGAFPFYRKNVTLEGNPNYNKEEADKIPPAAPKSPASTDPSVDKWFFISGTASV
jgi:inorganic pyrophosphatase